MNDGLRSRPYALAAKNAAAKLRLGLRSNGRMGCSPYPVAQPLGIGAFVGSPRGFDPDRVHRVELRSPHPSPESLP